VKLKVKVRNVSLRVGGGREGMGIMCSGTLREVLIPLRGEGRGEEGMRWNKK